MGGLCTSLFSSSQSTTTTVPPEIKSAVTDILNRAATQSNQPYPQYTPETAAQYMGYNPGLVAPMTPQQVGAGQSIANLQGYTQPYMNAASALATYGSQPIQLQQFSPQAVNQYMSPYLSNVVNSAVANINQTNAQQQQQVLGNAIQKGAFGGDRAGIAQAELARQQGLANNATIANLLNQGYGQALNMFNTQQQLAANAQLQSQNLAQTGATNLANLGMKGQEAALQQAQAQYQYGTAAQQQQQAGLSTAYQQFLQQQAFPYQQLSYYAGLASGAAPALGSTTTAYTPTMGLYQQGAAGLGLLGQLGQLGSLSNSMFGGSLGGGGGSIFSGFGLGSPQLKDGGRVGYADGGAPTNESIQQAYNDYISAVSSGASYDDLMRLYERYQQAFKNASLPTQITPVQPAAKADVPAEKAAPASATTGGGGGGGTGVRATGVPDYERSDIGTKAYPKGGREIIEGEPLDIGQNQTLNAVLKGNAPLLTGDYPQQNVLSGLGQGLGQVLSLMSPLGILSAFNRDPKVVAEEMSKMYGEQNRVAAPVYDEAGNQIDIPNTASGQNLAEYMDQMKISDPSEVRMGMTQVNGRWQPEFFKDSTIGRMVHPNSVPALDVPGVKFGSDSASRQAEEGFAIPGGGEGVSGATAGAAKGLRTPGQFSLADLTSYEKAYGLPTGYMAAQAQIESDLDPNAKNPRSTAAGLYQIIAENAQKAGINPLNPEQAAGWTAPNAADNAEKLRAAGYPVSNATLALAHNFGIQGALSLLSDPQRSMYDAMKEAYSKVYDDPNQIENAALAAVVHNKYNISDPSATALGRLESRMNAALDKIGPLSTQQPGWMQPRGSNITNERPFGPIPDQQTAASQMQQLGRYDLGNIGRQVSDASAAQQAQRYDIGNIGRQVSEPNVVRAFEAQQDRGGGGGGSLDRSGPSMAESSSGNRSAESGGNQGSLGGRGSFATSPDSGGAFSSSYSAREKRGGRIEKADAGGISMQYGMPSEDDIQRMAQSYAGSGAYNLSPTQQALAAKGVFGAATGGRIHKQDAGGISADEESPSIFQRFSNFLYPNVNRDAMRNEMMGLNPDGSPKYRMPERSDFTSPSIRPSRETLRPIVTPRDIDLNARDPDAILPMRVGMINPNEAYGERPSEGIYPARSWRSTMNMEGTVPPRTDARGAIMPMSPSQIEAMDQLPRKKYVQEPMNPNEAYYSKRNIFTGELAKYPMVKEAPRVGPVEAYGEPASRAAGTYTAPYEAGQRSDAAQAPAKSKTVPRVNPIEAYGEEPLPTKDLEAMKKAMGTGAANKAPAAAPAGQQALLGAVQNGSLIQPAGDLTKSEVGGQGYRKYAAPIPYELKNRPDMDALLRFKFFSSLIPGAGGTAVANAASNYARDVMALQAQQEGYQKGQYEAAKGYADEEKLLAEARTQIPATAAASKASATKTMGEVPGTLGGRNVAVFDRAGNPIGYVNVPYPEEGQAVMFGSGAGSQAPITGSGAAPISGQGAAPISGGQQAPTVTMTKPTTSRSAIPEAQFGAFAPETTQADRQSNLDKLYQYADRDYKVGNENPALMQKSLNDADKVKETVDAEASAAPAIRRDLTTSVDAFTRLGDAKEGDFTGAGPFASERQRLANYVLTLNNLFGFSDKDPDKINENDIISGQLYQKMSRLSTHGNARANEAWGSIKDLQDAYPNADQEKLVQAAILSSFLVNNIKAIDKQNAWSLYKKRSRGAGSDFNTAFNNVTSANYEAEKKAIADMLMATRTDDKGQRVNAISYLIKLASNPKTKDIAIKQFNDAAAQNYGLANMSRIFVGE